jgi:hypothetical protein
MSEEGMKRYMLEDVQEAVGGLSRSTIRSNSTTSFRMRNNKQKIKENLSGHQVTRAEIAFSIPCPNLSIVSQSPFNAWRFYGEVVAGTVP